MYWVNESGNNNRPNWRQFYCDSDDDIANLPTSIDDGVEQSVDKYAHRPCCIGSECFSLSGSFYILNSNNEWTKI